MNHSKSNSPGLTYHFNLSMFVHNCHSSSHSKQDLLSWQPQTHTCMQMSNIQVDTTTASTATTKQGTKYCLPTTSTWIMAVWHCSVPKARFSAPPLQSFHPSLHLISPPPLLLSSCLLKWASLLYQKQTGSLEEGQNYYLSHSSSSCRSSNSR